MRNSWSCLVALLILVSGCHENITEPIGTDGEGTVTTVAVILL